MSFKNPNQRKGFFEKEQALGKIGNQAPSIPSVGVTPKTSVPGATSSPYGKPGVMSVQEQPTQTPPAGPKIEPVKVAGLPKPRVFNRTKRFFKV
jgi:hypothetical protein